MAMRKVKSGNQGHQEGCNWIWEDERKGSIADRSRTARAGKRPLLAAFDNIHLTVIPVAGQLHYQVTPLTPVQQRILELWELSDTLYTQFSI